eukprot:14184570-Alexandrium_andersonii.AAC.1
MRAFAIKKLASAETVTCTGWLRGKLAGLGPQCSVSVQIVRACCKAPSGHNRAAAGHPRPGAEQSAEPKLGPRG